MSESELMNAANGSLLDISLEEKSSTSERFSCGICEESYYRKASLNRHLKTHENGCIKCSVCTQFFKTEEDKKKHIEVKHSPIVCESCGKIFSSRNYIEFHKKTHEAELVNYDKQCPFANCGKIFRQSSKFQDHLNTHTGAKPYSCEHCRKTFNSRYAQSEHVLVCSKEKVFKCHVCDTVYSHRASLRNHMVAKHSDQKFICTCDATYKYMSGLVRHKKASGHV
ncbi:hypothetical protein DPMN_006921 [Dreissena polymorpha]|uniref:C2H2-type domain-containing protein n=1 Tax=Dreissena polymorpha TaxID=45954 RepID=A0A9D4RVU3_DREPO|nr:hypothetical protein DPMN_006921 [Dreissena polymorpha]